MKRIEKFLNYCTSVFFLPHFVIFLLHPKREIIQYELLQYSRNILRETNSVTRSFFKIFVLIPDFRNLFLLRVGWIGHILRFITICRSNLYIQTDINSIGQGLILHHAFSTIILCRAIGENCQIWQMVTIGKNISGPGIEQTPIIKQNVKICAGAIVIGKITIGNNVTIGAGTLISKDVPDNVTVIGNPAIIIRRNGHTVYEKL